MAAIMMPCPVTGETVATGQHVSPQEFAAADIMGGRFRCSSCQQVHDWTKDQVSLVDWPGRTSG